MKVTNLRVEDTVCPMFIDMPQPVFSWNAADTEDNWKQNAYRIIVATENSAIHKHIVWDSGIVETDRMAYLPYDGRTLCSDTRYYWHVEVWPASGEPKAISEPAWFETALLHDTDWQGLFIGETADGEYHCFRKAFHLTKPLQQAKLFVCGLGHCVFSLNGQRVGNRVLEPGWTDYRKTIPYSVYTVTSLLHQGQNAAGAILADGMYNVVGGRHVYYKRSYGHMKLRAQLHLTYADGSTDCIVTDESWRMGPSPYTFCCIYGGADYDARRMPVGFDTPEFREDESWQTASVVDAPQGKARCLGIQPLKVMQTYTPISVHKIKPLRYVIDFGKNHSGFVRLRLSCAAEAAGRSICIKPSELLSPEGLPVQPLTPNGYEWNYTCSNDADQQFNPDLTYTGYRYVRIDGAALPEDTADDAQAPVLQQIESCFLYPDAEASGQFHCSNPLLNDIHALVRQAILSNMKSILTDCPHREKLGWLEQTHLIGPSIMAGFPVRNLYAKISQDMADSQYENGLVPDVCPGYVGEAFAQWHTGYLDSPEWGCACIINPWYVYRFYGDISLLKRHYGSMKRYILYLAEKSHHGILCHGLGDWLDIGVQKPFSQNTPIQVVATNIYYYALTLMEQTAVLLEHHKDADMYRRMMSETYTEYNALFFDDQTNRYATGSQTVQAMSLISGLFLHEREQQIFDQLVRDIELREYAITCGDIGHPFVVAALTKYERNDVLYAMTTVTDKPGYGYQVIYGATALTEEWDGPSPGDPHGSQNHLMLGSIEEWFFCGLAGLQSIRSELPFGQLLIQPHFPPELSALDAHIMHPYGKVSVSWRRDGNIIRLELRIPANLTARFVNEYSGREQTLGSGAHTFQLKAL